jgi:excisionase family DNA binding protein
MTHHSYSADHACDPDGFNTEATAAPPRDGHRELPRERYPVRDGQQPTTRQSARAPVESGADRPTEPHGRPGAAATMTPPGSWASPLPGAPGHPNGNGAAEGAGPSTGEPAGDPVPALFTPAQAAELLQVPESWLRRRAARRLVPCTFLGKHLRFSRADLDQILAEAARPATPAPRAASGTSAVPRRRGRPRARARMDVRRPDAGKRTHSSGA